MKSTLKVGKIQKAVEQKESNEINSQIRKNANQMKIGEFFEVTGNFDRGTLNSLRATLCYFSKKDGFAVATSFSNNKLTIRRVRKERSK